MTLFEMYENGKKVTVILKDTNKKVTGLLAEYESVADSDDMQIHIGIMQEGYILDIPESDIESIEIV